VRHVLVVEENADVCKAIESTLLTGGPYRVTPTLAPDDAIEVIAEDRPDIAIIDTVLPKVSGLKLAGRATELGVPVLIITADDATERKLQEVGCPFLSKPFSIKVLVETTERLMKTKAQHRARMSALLARLLENTAEHRRAVNGARKTTERSRVERANGAHRRPHPFSRTRKLRTVARPANGKILQAPPVITVSSDTNYYLCGSCDSLLVIAEKEHLHNLFVQCRTCGSCNVSDS
jgi:DNA-binding response OmpR family regulator